MFLNDEEKVQIKNYLLDIFSGKICVSGPWKFWQKGFSFCPKRMVIKVVDAKPLCEFFEKTFDAKIIYSTRHPIPTSLSVLRNRWGLTADAYLSNKEFVERYLDSKQFSKCMDIMSADHLLSKYVLNWGLENIVIFKYYSLHKDGLFLSYEELVTKPEESIRFLMEKFDLDNFSRMMAALKSPSQSVRFYSEKNFIKHWQTKVTDPQIFISSWRKDVDENYEIELLKILEMLEIDLYRAKDNYPKWINFEHGH